MFDYEHCYHQIINNTINKYCYKCDSFCEFSILIIFFLIISSCIEIFCIKKIQSKEIIVFDPESPPPYE